MLDHYSKEGWKRGRADGVNAVREHGRKMVARGQFGERDVQTVLLEDAGVVGDLEWQGTLMLEDTDSESGCGGRGRWLAACGQNQGSKEAQDGGTFLEGIVWSI